MSDSWYSVFTLVLICDRCLDDLIVRHCPDCNANLHHTISFCIVLHSTALHCTALHCTALHCTAFILHSSQYCTVTLYYITP